MPQKTIFIHVHEGVSVASLLPKARVVLGVLTLCCTKVQTSLKVNNQRCYPCKLHSSFSITDYIVRAN